MTVYMTKIEVSIFSTKPIEGNQEDVMRDHIKIAAQDIWGGVADVDFGVTSEMTGEVGRDALWHHGFEPTILDQDEE